MGTLLQTLGISRNEVDSATERASTIAEFLADAAEAFEKSEPLLDAVAKALPWAAAVGEAAAEVLPPVKFLMKLLKSLTHESDPEKLAYLACSMAYQQAVEQSIRAIGAPKVPQALDKATRRGLQSLARPDDIDFKRFSLDTALQHPFVKEADGLLEVFLQEYAGYDEREARQVTTEVHFRFVSHLKTILSHGDLNERFRPFLERMELGSAEAQAYGALLDHAELQRWLYEEASVLNEPFSLAEVYTDTDCGLVWWGEIRGDGAKGKKREERDPFNEKCGGRHPLLATVMNLLADPMLKEPIVLQGTAGAGKSSFTLRLCAELIRQGLRPIRIRMRDLATEGEILETLAGAVALHDPSRTPEGSRYPRPEDLFLRGASSTRPSRSRE